MMLKRFILSLILAMVILPFGLLALMATSAGSRWLVEHAVCLMPNKVSVASVEGQLLQKITLTGLQIQNPAQTVNIGQITFAWQPAKLATGRLFISEISLDNIQIENRTEATAKSNPFDADRTFNLPLELTLEQVAITRLNITTNTQTQQIDKLILSAESQNGSLNLKTLNLQNPQVTADLQGQIGLGKGWPLQINSQWHLQLADNGQWQGASQIQGNLHQLHINSQLNAPWPVQLKADITQPMAEPQFTIQADWQNAQWPVSGNNPNLHSPQGTLQVNGSLNRYQIDINSQLSQANVPNSRVKIFATGSINALNLKQCTIDSKTGNFNITGQIAWQTGLDLVALGQNFNPVILNPELPGRLNFNTHLKANRTTVQETLLEINQLTGQLRGYPLKASGKLTQNGKQWQVQALKLQSGNNGLDINGRYAPTGSNLTLNLNLPNLKTLWPGLAGSVLASGQLQGDGTLPPLNLTASAKNLSYVKTRAEKLALDIDWQAESTKPSKLNLQIKNITSDVLNLQSFSLIGAGTQNQHRFKADMFSDWGVWAGELTGSYNQKIWQGQLQQLNLDSQQIGQWRLNHAMPIRVIQTPAGYTSSVANTCWQQQDSALCFAGEYSANQDIKLAIKSQSLPLTLLKPWLSAEWQSNASINGSATLQGQKGILNGMYRFTAQPSTLRIGQQALALGTADVSGNLKNQQVSSAIALDLPGQDTLTAQGQWSLDKSSRVAGQIKLAIANLSQYQHLLPTLTELNGRLTADWQLSGTLNQPFFNGVTELSQARIVTPQLTVSDINLHAKANGQTINLQGSVSPQQIKRGDQTPLTMQTVINLSAQLKLPNQKLQGEFALDTTGLTLRAGDDKNWQLGASQLSGTIADQHLTSQWTFGLLGQDYCRGQLQADTAEKGSLKGQISTSITNFSWLSAWAPELSEIKGHLLSDISLDGNLKKPQILGEIQLKNGQLGVNTLGIRVTDINLTAQSSLPQPDSLQISGTAQSGTGKLKLAGTADLTDQTQPLLSLTLDGENFEVAKLPEAEIALSPALAIQSQDQQIKVGGNLKVPKALLIMQELPENAIKVSPDELILGEPPKQETSPSMPVSTDINIELGKNVSFTGQGLRTHLKGNLNVTTKAGQLAMNGHVDLTDATFKRFGQDLKVRKGRFIFYGPADNPYVELEATRLSKSKTVTAVLALSGQLRQPKTNIYAEPTQPEADAIAYLVTGAPLSQASQSNRDALASAALSYGAGQMTWLTNKLGVDELSLEQGQTLQDSLLAVGQYLTPDFYIGTKVGLFNKQAVLVLKHNLTPTLNLETQTGSSQRVKINYEFDRD